MNWRYPMSVHMVRSRVRDESVADVESAVRDMFAAIRREQLEGIRYASCRLPDGVSYVALLEVDDGVDNPLPALPEFRAFQEGLKGWLAEAPGPEQLTVIGSYRLFDTAD
jgi:hypothetical protein